MFMHPFLNISGISTLTLNEIPYKALTVSVYGAKLDYVSHTGRHFYKCGNNNGCKFFLWASEGQQSNDDTRNTGTQSMLGVIFLYTLAL